MTPGRVPAGVPSGGQFAALARPEASVVLDADDLPSWEPPAGLETPDGAFSRCKEVSAAYTEHLRAHGIDARWVQVSGARRSYPAALPAWLGIERGFWNHYVTVVDGRHIDWTARQFDPEAALPAVEESLDGQWDDVYDVTDALDRYLAAWRSKTRGR